VAHHKFFSRESCGQCTPCREGSGWIERSMYRIEHGGGRLEDLDLLLDLCDNIAPGLTWPPQQTTICVLGPSIPSSVHSAIKCSATTSSPTSNSVGAPMTDVIKTTVTITVNGRSIEAQPGELLIEAAERAGNYIPRFCYHPRMEVGRLLPHVPGRGRFAPWRNAPAGLLLEGQ
jgi:hypothetical protein